MPQPDSTFRRALVIGLLAVALTAVMGLVGATSDRTHDLLKEWREQLGPYSIGIGNLFSAIMGVMLFFPGFEGRSESLHEPDRGPVSLSKAFRRRFLVGAITLPVLLDLPAALLSRTLFPHPESLHVPWIFITVHLTGDLATVPVQHLAVYSTAVLVGSVVKRPFFAAGLAAAGIILVYFIPEWCRTTGTTSNEGWGITGATQGVWSFMSWVLPPHVSWEWRPFVAEWMQYGAYCLFNFGISLTCTIAAYLATRRGLVWRKAGPATSRERPS